MNRIIVAAVAAALASTTFAVAAMEEMDMKAMDANHDGMVSKAEFMRTRRAAMRCLPVDPSIPRDAATSFGSGTPRRRQRHRGDRKTSERGKSLRAMSAGTGNASGCLGSDRHDRPRHGFT